MKSAVRGYKAFLSVGGYLFCRDMMYMEGVTYSLPEDIEPVMCKCGFHFCSNLFEVFGYYPLNRDIRVCEVESEGRVFRRRRSSMTEGKCVTDKLRIVRRLSVREILARLAEESNNRWISPHWREEAWGRRNILMKEFGMEEL